MNERILELADEARIKFSSHWAHEGVDTAVIIRRDLKEFAELIVRECEKVISDGRYSAMACEGNSHRVSYNNGRYGASLDIKKHFGVEE